MTSTRARYEGEQFRHALTENMPAGAYTMTLEPGAVIARFEYVSCAFLEMCGLTQEQAMADAASALAACVHPEDYALWIQKNVEAFTNKTRFSGETRIIVNGKVRWVRAESIPRHRHDGATVWEGVIIDITSLKETQNQLETVIECTQGGLWVLDVMSGLGKVNSHWANILGYSISDFNQWSEDLWISTVSLEDQKDLKDILYNLKSGINRKAEYIYRALHRDGHYVWVKSHFGISSYNPDGTPEKISGVIFDVTHEKRSEEKLIQFAYKDNLTGLASRNLIIKEIEIAIERAHIEETKFAIMFLDLDGFKEINDNYGHSVGDLVLRKFGHVLSQVARDSDCTGRLGGDEFIILLNKCKNKNDAARFSERIFRKLSKPLNIEGKSIMIKCSIGCAIYPDNGDDLESLMRSADSFMYAMKRENKRKIGENSP